MSEKFEYPCTDCKEEQECNRQRKYLRCDAWLNWFRRQWAEIRKLFGHECVESQQKEKESDGCERGDLNEE